ncbi:MAG: GIY-YIG nuclease superfamily protein [Synergistetes bacterium ADurb.Bin155]|nr:MAG: GIY-YIG nuclease superfamily protein [Synergistetes bacterium ADurb.Bin155]
MYYVYVLENEEGGTYTGYTRDLRERMKRHENGDTKSTRGKRWTLVYYEAYFSKKDATMRERRLKRSHQARRWLRERIASSMEEALNGIC